MNWLIFAALSYHPFIGIACFVQCNVQIVSYRHHYYYHFHIQPPTLQEAMVHNFIARYLDVVEFYRFLIH